MCAVALADAEAGAETEVEVDVADGIVCVPCYVVGGLCTCVVPLGRLLMMIGG